MMLLVVIIWFYVCGWFAAAGLVRETQGRTVTASRAMLVSLLWPLQVTFGVCAGVVHGVSGTWKDDAKQSPNWASRTVVRPPGAPAGKAGDAAREGKS